MSGIRTTAVGSWPPPFGLRPALRPFWRGEVDEDDPEISAALVAEAESAGRADAATAQLRAMSNGSQASTEVGAAARALATQLRERGFEAHVAVGKSNFRVDVAIAVDGRYRVGVLFEPESDAAELAVDRYISEPGVLQAFGWKIIRVPLSDWLIGANRVIDRITSTVH